MAAKLATGLVTFRKGEIDGIHMDTRHKRFREDFSISLELTKPPISPADFPFTPAYDSLAHHPLAPGLRDHDIDSYKKKHPPAVAGSAGLVEIQESLNEDFRSAGYRSLPCAAEDMETPEMETPSPPSPPSPPAASYVAASALRTSSSAGNALQDPRRSMTLNMERETGTSLHEVVERVCSGVRTFKYGQAVLDTTNPEPKTHMTVYYVVSGRVQLEPWKAGVAGAWTGPVSGWSGCLGMPDIERCSTVGRGQVFGTLGLGRLVPGGRDLGGGLLYRVMSDEAQIAVIRLSPQLHDQLENGPESESIDHANMVIYEQIARGLAEWTASITRQIRLLKKPRKAHPSRTTALAARKKLYERVMMLHALPTDEKVLTNCQVIHVARKRTNGTLLLFKFSLVFRAQNSMGTNIAQDIVIPLDHVLDVSLKKDMLTVKYSNESLNDSYSGSGSPHKAVTPTSPLSAVGSSTPMAGDRAGKQAGGHIGSFSASMRRFSGPAYKFNPTSSAMPEVSFMITGIGGTGSVSGNATAMLGKVLRQQALVKHRMDRGLGQGMEGLENVRDQIALTGVQNQADLLAAQRLLADGLSPEQETLRRWGLLLLDEDMSEKTMKMLSVLMCNARRHRYMPGEIIIQAGDEGRRLVLIDKGRVARSKRGEKQEVRQGGDVIGVKSLFTSGNYGSTTSVIAETETEVFFIERQVSASGSQILIKQRAPSIRCGQTSGLSGLVAPGVAVDVPALPCSGRAHLPPPRHEPRHAAVVAVRAAERGGGGGAWWPWRTGPTLPWCCSRKVADQLASSPHFRRASDAIHRQGVKDIARCG